MTIEAVETTEPFKISWTTLGVARPKGSLKPINAPGRKTILVEQVHDGPAWRRIVAQDAIFAFQGECRLRGRDPDVITGAVAVRMVAGFAPTQEVIKLRRRMTEGKIPLRELYPSTTGTPDTDKIQRNIGDALVDAGVIKNDAQVVQWVAAKVYNAEHVGPTCLIELVELP